MAESETYDIEEEGLFDAAVGNENVKQRLECGELGD
jgi:hypothetical protein